MAAIFTNLKSFNKNLANVGVHVCQDSTNTLNENTHTSLGLGAKSYQ
jgi:hypothetical protein